MADRSTAPVGDDLSALGRASNAAQAGVSRRRRTSGRIPSEDAALLGITATKHLHEEVASGILKNASPAPLETLSTAPRSDGLLAEGGFSASALLRIWRWETRNGCQKKSARMWRRRAPR